MSFQVHTDSFQGPFDLLLQLILKDDVDLYEVRLCEIVDAYLEEVARLEACDLEVSTEFLLIAATLVELKCRRLLPIDDGIDLDEELGLWEERDMLLARLLECKTFKDASAVLVGLMDSASRSVPRRVGLEEMQKVASPMPKTEYSPNCPDSKVKSFCSFLSLKLKWKVTTPGVSSITLSMTAMCGR